jgi:hypothetical protein
VDVQKLESQLLVPRNLFLDRQGWDPWPYDGRDDAGEKSLRMRYCFAFFFSFFFFFIIIIYFYEL